MWSGARAAQGGNTRLESLPADRLRSRLDLVVATTFELERRANLGRGRCQRHSAAGGLSDARAAPFAAASRNPAEVSPDVDTGPRIRSSTATSPLTPSANVRRSTPWSMTTTAVISGVSPITGAVRSADVSHRRGPGASSQAARPGGAPTRPARTAAAAAGACSRSPRVSREAPGRLAQARDRAVRAGIARWAIPALGHGPRPDAVGTKSHIVAAGNPGRDCGTPRLSAAAVPVTSASGHVAELGGDMRWRPAETSRVGPALHGLGGFAAHCSCSHVRAYTRKRREQQCMLS